MKCIRRHEDGSIVVLVALAMPVVLLFAALVIDIGNWKEKQRSLQARADAAALSAGVEYGKRFRACATDSAGTGAFITAAAKQYAGATGSTAPQNRGINEQTRVWVGVNAADYDGTDNTDGTASPCDKHTTADSISAANTIWADVKMTESDIPSFFGALGFPLSKVKARARVELRTVKSLNENARGLPIVVESGDYVPCAWALLWDTNANTAVPNAALAGGQTNPIPLTPVAGQIRTWESPQFTLNTSNLASRKNDVAVRIVFGNPTGGSCSYSTDNKAELPHNTSTLTPFVGGFDWINVWDAGAGTAIDPVIESVETTAGSCPGVGYIYSKTACTLNVRAMVDFGANSPDSLGAEVTLKDSRGTDVQLLPSSPSLAVPQYWQGVVTIDPTAVSGSDPQQNYTQTGQHRFTFEWNRTKNPKGSGAFPGVQNAVYVFDPIGSSPISYAEIVGVGGGPIVNSVEAGESFSGRVRVKNFGLEDDHVYVIRGSVQETDNRTGTVECGANGNAGIVDAITGGCQDEVQINTRVDGNGNRTYACSMPWPNSIRDCVGDQSASTGDKTSDQKAYDDRFGCTPNNWPDPQPGDRRLTYVFVTTFGSLTGSNSDGMFPVVKLVGFYVTGFDSKAGCNLNEPDPRGVNRSGNSGARIWGHYTDYVDISGGTDPGSDPCDLNTEPYLCMPVLVR